jgi:hypothetical protein
MIRQNGRCQLIRVALGVPRHGTLARLKEALAGAPIDVLWIDADHTYEGVSQGMAMYAPLVRNGGGVLVD